MKRERISPTGWQSENKSHKQSRAIAIDGTGHALDAVFDTRQAQAGIDPQSPVEFDDRIDLSDNTCCILEVDDKIVD